MRLLADNKAVSRAEFIITAVFVFVVSTVGGALAFPEFFSAQTGWTGIIGELGSNASLWLIGVLIAGALILMIKRSR